MLRRRFEFKRINISVQRKDPLVTVSGTIYITTPEQDPTLVELDYRIRLKDNPAMSAEDLPRHILNLLADRLEKPMPELDPPGSE